MATSEAAQKRPKRAGRPAAATAADRRRREGGKHPYRMQDLCRETGLGRQAVHFYIQQGLLPEGHKTGRNMAYYSQTHVDRLRLIRRLQEEQFLPLKAIRAVLDVYDDQATFSPAQQQLLEAVKRQLRPSLAPDAELRLTEPVGPLLERVRLSSQDFDALVETGLVAAAEVDGERVVRQADVWLVENFAELRHLGFTRELGFVAADLALIDELVTTLFRRETALLSGRLAALDPAEVAGLIERALPHINTLLVRLHESKLRNFLAGR